MWISINIWWVQTTAEGLSRGLSMCVLCPSSSLLMSGPDTQRLRPVWKLTLLSPLFGVAHNLPGMLVFDSTSHTLMVLLLQVGDFLPIHCCCCSARWHSGTMYAFTLFWWLSTIRPAGGWGTSWALLYSIRPRWTSSRMSSLSERMLLLQPSWVAFGSCSCLKTCAPLQLSLSCLLPMLCEATGLRRVFFQLPSVGSLHFSLYSASWAVVPGQ